MFLGDLFSIIVILFIVIISIVVIGLIIYAIVKSTKQRIANDNSPLLTVPAQIVTKRTHVQGDHSYTSYFVTFEVQSGDRIELSVKGKEYGLLVENDLGMLSFQGTRYISFDRNNASSY